MALLNVPPFSDATNPRFLILRVNWAEAPPRVASHIHAHIAVFGYGTHAAQDFRPRWKHLPWGDVVIDCGPNPLTRSALFLKYGVSATTIARVISQNQEGKVREKCRVYALSNKQTKQRLDRGPRFLRYINSRKWKNVIAVDEAWVYLTDVNGIRKIYYEFRGERKRKDDWTNGEANGDKGKHTTCDLCVKQSVLRRKALLAQILEIEAELTLNKGNMLRTRYWAVETEMSDLPDELLQELLRYLDFSSCTCRPATAQDIELIVSLPSIPHWMADSQWVGPAFDVAAERVKRRFGSRASKIRATYLGDETAANCNDFSAQSARRISEYYFKNASISTPGTCYALVTSPCNDDTGISSLAKEFDWPSFDILPLSDEVPPSPTRSLPANEIAIFGAIWGYSQILLEILQDFGWYHATILTEVKPGFGLFYAHLESSLVAMSHIIHMEKRITLTQRMISTADRLTIQDGLSFAKTKSRVLIILAPVGSVIRILVFINTQLEGRSEGPSGRLANLDNIEFQEFPVFRSLLMLTYYPTGQELMHLNEEIETRAQTAYHSTYPKNTKPLDNVPVRAAYDIVELLAAVLYTSRSENSSRVTAEGTSTENPCGGLKFAKATTNRLRSLPPNQLSSTRNRHRNIDLDIFAVRSDIKGEDRRTVSVRSLEERDELHMEQDSKLVDIDDLSRRLKEQWMVNWKRHIMAEKDGKPSSLEESGAFARPYEQRNAFNNRNTFSSHPEDDEETSFPEPTVATTPTSSLRNFRQRIKSLLS
ncbi:hypothetical protein BV898_05961 [Hypsibius exemplaris]|uniref:Schwannomin interacting protein 1 C-terminal domain-containing protein n=1 Tax=Hypsibius exemplaris TaxID=2072580 RepID=A0A1W0WXS0_HYPEX|nr:hypothetical protein BV898_05961 [Hypsibius exemplaris]